MGATVVILTAGHLCHNPRVVKEAMALAAAGYDVRVLGNWFDPILKARDEALLSEMTFGFRPVVDFTSVRTAERARQLYLRARAKATRTLCRWTGLRSTFQLGLTTRGLYREAAKIDAALYIAHLEPTLPVALTLLGAGKRVAVDMEDWYSEDLLPEARTHRPVLLLRRLERQVLQQVAHATCTSHAMSQALATAYGCPAPTVIYNSCRWADRASIDHLLEDRHNRRTPSIHWYSQTIGPGRGLEDLLDALPHLTRDAEIHLRGNPVAGFEDWLSSRVPERLRDRIFVHGLVSNDRLLSRIAEHDIGFAGEMKFCRSRDLTVTNKMMEYLLAGLAVVASDTAGQREVAEQAPGATFLYASGEPLALASQLNALLESSDLLRRAKSAALCAAEQVFSWERQEHQFLETVAAAIGQPASRQEVV
jgi:glycosyltransferase involved in cell wall biosynthesis